MNIEQTKQLLLRAGIAELNAMQTAMLAADCRSVALLAPTGSGKTLAFTAGVLRRLRPAGQGVQAIVIAPARELVQQIARVMHSVTPGYKLLAIYGGSKFADEAASIAGAMPDIIVATPGRLLDHLNRGTLSLAGSIRYTLVLDEYDKALELGFHDEMRRIMRRLPSPAAIILTSATRLGEMPEFIDTKDLVTLDYSGGDTAMAQGHVEYINVPSADRDKLAILIDLLRALRGKSAVVFVNHRESAERVAKALTKAKIDNSLYHGGLDQHDREIALARFDSDTVPVLVATDLAGRGLDIKDVDAVIHYHMPVSEQVWTHRNGRTARAGANGEVYVITGPDESTPDYLNTDHDYYPPADVDPRPVRTGRRLIYINLGKRDKVSRGDIAGFLMKQCGLPKDAVGRITVGADYALAAVDAGAVAAILAADARIKNKRARLSTI